MKIHTCVRNKKVNSVLCTANWISHPTWRVGKFPSHDRSLTTDIPPSPLNNENYYFI